jgi:elongation factor P--(R)-beta-lysine ligase
MRWQPTASLAALQARAKLNQHIRQFFAERNVLEVETPLLCQAAGTDLNLHPFVAHYQPYPAAPSAARYLQTSPEFAMKRLLAAGSGAIYQLGKAFRNGDSGQKHNPEFTMLEWYRPGFSLAQLMDEVEALVNTALVSTALIGTALMSTALSWPANRPFQRLSYRALFQQHFGFDPHTVSLSNVQAAVLAHITVAASALSSRAVCLDLLYGHVIEPRLIEPVFIYDYPAEQAALARIDTDAQGQHVALRFELVMQGMELANGYDELCDADEQARRFTADTQQRQQQGLPNITPDQRFLAALASGLPACAGVALGVDRLLMLQLGTQDIADVLTFPHASA